MGTISGGIVGALNGYLIFGTIWFYMDRLDYPIRQYSWFTPNLTDLANNMVNLLPQNIAGGLVMSGLALTLLWWRIAK